MLRTAIGMTISSIRKEGGCMLLSMLHVLTYCTM